MTAEWITNLILAASCFARNNIDVDSACYLKSDDGSKCMRSDCVSPMAPQAVAWDWRLR